MKNNYLYIIICIIVVLTLIIFSLGLFYFRWFDGLIDKQNSYKVISESFDVLNGKKEEKAKTEKPEIKDDKELKKESTKEAVKELAKKENISTEKTASKEIHTTQIYGKGSTIPDQSFDSLGEYISNEEYNYRIALIKSLSIKTVVINKLTKGNGVSQEYFRVAYIEKMIPAKILGEVVESKEFRNIIPKKYLSKEVKIKGLSGSDSITFTNYKIKEILLLWCLGRLTPVQKAWEVKAEK